VNAYTLSQDLYTFKRKSDFPKTLNAKEEAEKKKEAEALIAKLYYYINTDKSSDLYQVIGQDSLLQDLVSKIQTAANYIPNNKKLKTIKDSLLDDKVFSAYKPQAEELQVIHENLKSIVKSSHTYQDSLFYLEKGKSFTFPDKITKIKVNDTLDVYSKAEFELLVKTYDTLITGLDSRLIQIFDSLAITEANPYKLLFSNPVEYKNADFERTLSHIQNNNYEISLADDNSSGSIAGWKMPSEAEMIDAVATYIASRVKQETVLWFFEEMRINTERYELLNTAFPETVKLLKTGEIFEAPNMGAAWKYALSEDFIKLPEHIINSAWLDERLPEDKDDELELLKVAADISHMVNNRLSYDDIIKQLYMKNCITNSADKPKILTGSISFLYAVSTELTVLAKDSTLRNITFEELQAMPLDRMQILLRLLNVKYQNCIVNQYAEIFRKPITPAQKQKISVWIGNSLMALDQFDKILKQVKEGAQGNKQVSLFDGYNTWKLISEAMLSAFPDPERKDLKFSLDRMDEAFEVYHLMTEKNYAGAVVKTLQLVDSLLYKSQLAVSVNDYKQDFDFKIPVAVSTDNTEYYVNLMALDEFFLERRVKPKKFPKLAKKIGLSSITVKVDPKKYRLTKENNQWYLTIKPIDLKQVLIDANPEKWRNYKKRIKHLFDKLNTSQLDQIIENSPEWGGTYNKAKDTVFFAINSMVAQALISQDKKEMQMIQKLASFLNDVALADDAKELKKVVESYALPVGSYKQKRNAWQSFSLNAFAGPYVGYETSTPFGIREKIENPDGTVTRPMSEFGWNYGISVPIGLTYSKTIGKRTYANSRLSQNYRYNQDLIKIGRKNLYVRSKWNFSLTLSIVDIGAVVCYRMSNADSVLNQSFKWEQFISPGLHLGIALPRTPLVFQIGYQYTPQIRRIDVGGGATKELGMWRAYAGLYFDIPMFNMWIKTRSVHFE
jgi:hypothetical protein